jgi:hypothetical protein
MAEGKDRTSGMKSAYELALERMESQGIERPREDSLDRETLAQMEEVRRQAKARLAELEILHRDKLSELSDPEARRQADEEYRTDRRRIEEKRERTLRRLRSASGD